MGDRGATLRGILEKNEAAMTGTATAAYHLNHVTIELDASEVSALDEGLEGLPVSAEGHFEMREHPESGTRWVFKAHALRGSVPADGALDEDIVAETGDVAHDEPAGGEDVAMPAQTTRRAVPSDAPRTQDPPPRTGDAPPSPSEQPPR